MDLRAALGPRTKVAAVRVANEPMDRFPPLITYRCLADAAKLLGDASMAQLHAGGAAVTETLTMPRRGFGPRPVELLSPTSRTLYTALVDQLGESLPEPSRRKGAWNAHREFGRKGDHEHVVELDFASCYELIDHEDLCRELLMRSFEPDVVDALARLLLGMGRHGRGLPQMLGPSDILADAYLSIIDRQLMRAGHALHRFADDVRVLAADWNQANEIIEFAADRSRALGLILSSAKTGVKTRTVLDQEEAQAFDLLQQYLNEARTELVGVVEVDGPYGEPVFGLENRNDTDALGAAYNRILYQWHEDYRRSRTKRRPVDLAPGLAAHLNSALTFAHPQALSQELLVDLVFHDPPRLENVCGYLLRQSADGDSEYLVAMLDRLTAMARQSPWAKLWLLHLAGNCAQVPADVVQWMSRQLDDPHEVVRAEAAWACANHGNLGSKDLEKCYACATEITSAALAAVAARSSSPAGGSVNPKENASVVRAIRDEGPLNKAAYEWARESIRPF